ncbi:7069_t:CDS:2 [Entrophospora sp. SA101]|nr:7069_t:CDS:2 [Entrophospora sp. SA101]
MPPKDRARRQVDKNRIDESNLTRLLQDSLLEETISTLEYATRAKRITNVPVAQINIEKKASDVEELLKEKLKRIPYASIFKIPLNRFSQNNKGS